MWPGYQPPMRDELLSSWIFRNSIEHKIKPFSFTKFYLKTSSFWTRDVDKFITKEVFTLLQHQTPLLKGEIKAMQLGSYQDIIYNGELLTSYSQGISNLGIYHRKRRQNGLLVCPRCLSEEPYFKKKWRLLTSVGCLNCKTYYIDSCPNCNSPIIFQRLAIGDKSLYKEYPLYVCWKCHYDLRRFKQVKLPAKVIKYQEYIDDTIERKYNQHVDYSFLYFDVLHLFLKRVQSSSNLWIRIRDAFVKEFKLKNQELYKRSLFPSYQLRSEILPLIYKLLEDWPHYFISFCKKYSIRYSDFSRGDTQLPYWFYKGFTNYF